MAIRAHGLKTGPNDRCPCGSGRKFKKCCRWKFEKAVRDGHTSDEAVARAVIDQSEVEEMEVREVRRFASAMVADPTLVPGDTVLGFAKRHRIALGQWYRPPSSSGRGALAVAAVLGMAGLPGRGG